MQLFIRSGVEKWNCPPLFVSYLSCMFRKHGAPFDLLVYLYYAFDEILWYFRIIYIIPRQFNFDSHELCSYMMTKCVYFCQLGRELCSYLVAWNLCKISSALTNLHWRFCDSFGHVKWRWKVKLSTPMCFTFERYV